MAVACGVRPPATVRLAVPVTAATRVMPRPPRSAISAFAEGFSPPDPSPGPTRPGEGNFPGFARTLATVHASPVSSRKTRAENQPGSFQLGHVLGRDTAHSPPQHNTATNASARINALILHPAPSGPRPGLEITPECSAASILPSGVKLYMGGNIRVTPAVSRDTVRPSFPEVRAKRFTELAGRVELGDQGKSSSGAAECTLRFPGRPARASANDGGLAERDASNSAAGPGK
ncbi:hypothetical protein SKAU_G00298260 [Synaphobranchus kaupii]|uniref:Uncharacterized protein n=1 Tax=Synaphobranchus kaupii TaxID=118154 RepID=A0A9Q1EV64_SYNKA|nr:hypothetical protein SKAU_G00298260 [Synaphobranchus kaupii]